MIRPHPLPWTMPDRDWVHLEPDSAFHDDQPKPYKLRLGPTGFQGGVTSFSASFNEGELRALRDRIDAVLTAPYRVLILGGHDVPERLLEPALRSRLDMLHSHHSRLEVAIIDDLDGPAIRWCVDALVPVLFYPTAAAMVADGGSRAVIGLMAGEGDGTANWVAYLAAFDARIPCDWISIDPATVNP